MPLMRQIMINCASALWIFSNMFVTSCKQARNPEFPESRLIWLDSENLSTIYTERR